MSIDEPSAQPDSDEVFARLDSHFNRHYPDNSDVIEGRVFRNLRVCDKCSKLSIPVVILLGPRVNGLYFVYCMKCAEIEGVYAPPSDETSAR